MMELGVYTDPLVLAVVFNFSEAVKKLLESGRYDNNLSADITNGWFGSPIPVYYISRCWEICLGHEFKEPFNQITKKNYENARNILSLFKEKKGIQVKDIPFSEISPACWAFEDESDEEILRGKKKDFISLGIREVDLDLYIAVQKMDFKRAEELLYQGANPLYKHLDEDTLLDLCGVECGYQATHLAGELIRAPDLFINSIDYDEIGNIFRWAANELMWNLLESYRVKNKVQGRNYAKIEI